MTEVKKIEALETLMEFVNLGGLDVFLKIDSLYELVEENASELLNSGDLLDDIWNGLADYFASLDRKATDYEVYQMEQFLFLDALHNIDGEPISDENLADLIDIGRKGLKMDIEERRSLRVA